MDDGGGRGGEASLMEGPDTKGLIACRAYVCGVSPQPLFSLSLSLAPDVDRSGLGAALLASTQVHRTLLPHPQGNPILPGQITAGGGARESEAGRAMISGSQGGEAQTKGSWPRFISTQFLSTHSVQDPTRHQRELRK